MQTTGESALRQSQDSEDFYFGGNGDTTDPAEDEDFISSPAITLQNVILKCFPCPTWANLPLKKKQEYKKQRELRLFKTNTVYELPADGIG